MNCPYCGKKAEVVEKSFYYSSKRYKGKMFVCKDCDASVGTHKDTEQPLGSMANKELRGLRIKCHELLDPQWRSGQMTRKEVYATLRKETGVNHIAWSDENMCKKVIDYLSHAGEIGGLTK